MLKNLQTILHIHPCLHLAIECKFDFVVGNLPWIAWEAMSKSYRAGTLTIWQSYGIFEKMLMIKTHTR